MTHPLDYLCNTSLPRQYIATRRAADVCAVLNDLEWDQSPVLRANYVVAHPYPDVGVVRYIGDVGDGRRYRVWVGEHDYVCADEDCLLAFLLAQYW